MFLADGQDEEMCLNGGEEFTAYYCETARQVVMSPSHVKAPAGYPTGAFSRVRHQGFEPRTR